MTDKKINKILQYGKEILIIDKIIVSTKPMNLHIQLAGIFKEIKIELASKLIELYESDDDNVINEEIKSSNVNDQVEIQLLKNKVASLSKEMISSKELDKLLTEKLGVATTKKKVTTKRSTKSS